MRESARWSIGAAVILLTLLGALLRGEPLETTPTSFGNAPAGFGALHELLGALQLSGERSYARPEQLPPAATVWWIQPDGLCADVETDALEAGGSGVWRSLPWLRAGGTGVVWLPASPLPCLASAALEGLTLPTRAIDLLDPEAEHVVEPAEEEGEATPDHKLSGSLLRRERDLGGVPLRFFEADRGWEILATDRGGSPFALAHRVGSGRLVLLADAAPLQNRWLDHADAAPFAMDVALALGAPRLDEREHGILPTENPAVYLAKSAALPLFLGAAALALLLVWSGAALPRATLPETDDGSPTLEAFVDSLATLYAETRDHDRVLARYQEFTVSQLRRALRLPSEAPLQEVRRRLAARRGIDADRLLALSESGPCRGRTALRERVACLDALVEEAAG